MTFVKGKSGNPAGRKRGVLNKATRSAKEALEQAFEQRGGVPALQAWANKDPSGFYALWGKLIPKNVEMDGSLVIEIRRK